MAVSLKDTILQDVKAAMRSGDKARLGTLRLITAAIKQIEVDERKSLDDSEVVATLDKMSKQRRDSITQFDQAGRQDLVEKEQQELEVIQSYLPQPLTAEEINQLVDEAIRSTASTSMQDMGKLMAALKPQLAGKADMGEVSKLVKSKLTG